MSYFEYNDPTGLEQRMGIVVGVIDAEELCDSDVKDETALSVIRRNGVKRVTIRCNGISEKSPMVFVVAYGRW